MSQSGFAAEDATAPTPSPLTKIISIHNFSCKAKYSPGRLWRGKRCRTTGPRLPHWHSPGGETREGATKAASSYPPEPALLKYPCAPLHAVWHTSACTSAEGRSLLVNTCGSVRALPQKSAGSGSLILAPQVISHSTNEGYPLQHGSVSTLSPKETPVKAPLPGECTWLLHQVLQCNIIVMTLCLGLPNSPGPQHQTFLHKDLQSPSVDSSVHC